MSAPVLRLAGLPPIELTRSARARRLILRLDPLRGVVRLVVPAGVSAKEAERFLSRHHDWVATRLAEMPGRMPFASGQDVPFLGELHRIRHAGSPSARTVRADGEILVGGAPEHLPRRVTDYLRGEAAREVKTRARAKAASIGVDVAAVSVRDTSTRWGSCSRSGRLSFSWRLVMAPEPVLDYVVAHEVAHLRQMNHGPAFWALCRSLSSDADASRAWLKRHGAQLLRYG
jgi:predicted metal-dependent hydrolase